MGVVFARLSEDDKILAIARNIERAVAEEAAEEENPSAPSDDSQSTEKSMDA